MRLVFHVGLPKTGSTRIQKLAIQNRDILEQLGIYWPTCCGYAPGEGDTIGHHKLAHLLEMGKFDVVESMVFNAYLEAKGRGAECMLLSSEAFAGCNPKHFSNIFTAAPFLDIAIVCYIRSYPSNMLSWYAQDIHALTLIRDFGHWHKWLSKSFSMSRFVTECQSNFPKLLQARYYNRDELLGNDIWKDFADKFLRFYDPRPHHNSSNDAVGLRGSLLILKRSLNRISLIARAAESNIESPSSLMNGTAPEKEYLWHMFDLLSKIERFRNQNGYPLMDYEKEYLECVSLKEIDELETLSCLGDAAIDSMRDDANHIEQLSFKGFYQQLADDCKWILDWVNDLRENSPDYSEAIVAKNSDKIIKLFSCLSY